MSVFCPNCGTSVASADSFCPNCGTRFGAETLGQSGSARMGSQAAAPNASAAVGHYATPEEKGRRVVAYLIDLVPMLILALVHLLPIVGWMLYGFLHACYWLLRDVGGASIGKSVMGSFVASENGAPSTTSQRILRNVPLAIPGVIGMIPLIGIIFEFVVAVVIFGGEAILLLATGRRFGDRLAGTSVFRR